MSRRSFSDSVVVKGVGQVGAAVEHSSQSAAELRSKLVEVVGPQLIDCNLNDQGGTALSPGFTTEKCCDSCGSNIGQIAKAVHCKKINRRPRPASCTPPDRRTRTGLAPPDISTTKCNTGGALRGPDTRNAPRDQPAPFTEARDGANNIRSIAHVRKKNNRSNVLKARSSILQNAFEYAQASIKFVLGNDKRRKKAKSVLTAVHKKESRFHRTSNDRRSGFMNIHAPHET